ncbi:type II toxin-antitoxin system RelB/DinJ family antitoxin [Patescibacteria group bacterium]|nr:type II toxin-antitoxin system RelB/DinJ family antitoxin [Patescibacteria group bacterium]
MNDTVQLRVDSKTKKDVAKIFKSLGMDMSTGVKIYFQQVLNSQGIPFPVLTENGFTLQEERQILVESARTQKIYNQNKRRGHKSAKAMFAEIKSS